jgi:transcriptional regulator with XRE-family HTH domain
MATGTERATSLSGPRRCADRVVDDVERGSPVQVGTTPGSGVCRDGQTIDLMDVGALPPRDERRVELLDGWRTVRHASPREMVALASDRRVGAREKHSACTAWTAEPEVRSHPSEDRVATLATDLGVDEHALREALASALTQYPIRARGTALVARSEQRQRPPAPAETAAETAAEFNGRVGARLRAIRLGRGLSRREVAHRSGHEFTASALGAYERGSRSISIARLRRLAALYDVAVADLLPGPACDGATALQGQERDPDGVDVDVTRLVALWARERDVLLSYIRMVQRDRHQPKAAVVNLSGDEVRGLGRIFGYDEAAMRERLMDLGLCLTG